MITPGYQFFAVEQQILPLGPDFAETEANDFPMHHLLSSTQVCLEKIEHRLAVGRPSPEHGIVPGNLDLDLLLLTGLYLYPAGR